MKLGTNPKKIFLHPKSNFTICEKIKPSQMEVAPLHRTFVISHKRRLKRDLRDVRGIVRR